MYIHAPGNHDLEYNEREIIGKCSIRVTPTKILITSEGAGCGTLMLLAKYMVIGTISALIPK